MTCRRTKVYCSNCFGADVHKLCKRKLIMVFPVLSTGTFTAQSLMSYSSIGTAKSGISGALSD